MSDISNQLIKDSYNYVLQSDLSTGIVYRIGGNIPINPKFISGLTINDGFNYSNGTEQPGFVLTTDALGNASWGPISGSSSGDYLPLSGGTVSGATKFTDVLSANTFSASTYLGLPIDIYVTGGTYSDGTATFTNNTGGTFNLTGLTTPFTGGTVSGATNFLNGLTGLTISATTYQNLPIDVFVTGATKSGDVATFTNNTGGTFNLTGLTDTFLTGGTYDVNSETIILNNNNGSNISITGITLPSLLVTDGSVTVTPVTGITFSGATVVDDGGGDITVVTGTIRRNDTVGNINYCGFALTGSLESNPVWTITVITVALDGSVTSVVYYNVAWTDRYIL
jgi:hypothetical protein